MIITEIQYFFSKIIRFQAIFKDTVEFTCALEFKISSQPLFTSICFNLKSRKLMLPALHFLFHQFYKLKLSFCLFTQHQIQPPNNAVFRPLSSFLILHDRFPPPSEFHNNHIFKQYFPASPYCLHPMRILNY